jgi:hypothetical protein
MTTFAPSQKPAGPLGGYLPVGNVWSDGDTATRDGRTRGGNSAKYTYFDFPDTVSANGLRYYVERSDPDIRLGSSSFDRPMEINQKIDATNTDDGWVEIAPASYSFTYGSFGEIEFPVQEVATVRVYVANSSSTQQTMYINELQPHEITMPKHSHK